MDNINRLIVIGASAGGPSALRALVASLDPSLAAAVLVVQHSAPSVPWVLDQLLDRAGTLPAAYAQDGDLLEGGRILIAPPDHHLAVYDGRAHVVHGPRQNRARPSIDVLFRSAAVAGADKTVGVLLSGLLDDGALGLETIKRCGGITVVQEPEEALFAEMVQHALDTVDVDHRLRLSEIADLLNHLAGERPASLGKVPEDLRLEVRLALSAHSNEDQRRRMGFPSEFSCPACGGRLWQTESGRPKHFICEVGHSYSPQALLEGQEREIERALYVALRTLEERARMLERMVQEEREQGIPGSSSSLSDRASEARENAKVIRRLLLRVGFIEHVDALPEGV